MHACRYSYLELPRGCCLMKKSMLYCTVIRISSIASKAHSCYASALVPRLATSLEQGLAWNQEG